LAVHVLDVVEDLVPLVLGLAVDGADLADAVVAQAPHEVAADEATGAGHEHMIHCGLSSPGHGPPPGGRWPGR
jgi:hypothetical protein